MEINHIKEFIKLVEESNFLRASESLNVSQSALSKHIKSLEDELGYKLFDRSRRNIQNTPHGRIFLKYAKEIVSTIYQCNSELINYSSKNYQSLVVGTIPIMAPYKITDFLTEFQRENKNFKLTILEGDSSVLLDMLRNNKIDLAFTRKITEDEESDIIFHSYTTDKLIAVISKSHPLAKREWIDISELQYERFLMLPSKSRIYRLAKEMCETSGFTPDVIYTGERAENIIDLVSKNVGVSLLMEKPAVYLANQDVVIIPIKQTVISSIGVACLEKNRDKPQMKLFLEKIVHN